MSIKRESIVNTKYQWLYTSHDDFEFLHFIESVTDWDEACWVIHDSQFGENPGFQFDPAPKSSFPWTSACGLNVAFSFPGAISRMGSFRCEACCEAIRITPGKGTPHNDNTCRTKTAKSCEAEGE